MYTKAHMKLHVPKRWGLKKKKTETRNHVVTDTKIKEVKVLSISVFLCHIQMEKLKRKKKFRK